MPIVTHEDAIELAKLDVEVAHLFTKIAHKINSLGSQEKKLGEMYQSYGKDLQEYLRKLRDKSKQMDVLSREEHSGVESEDVADCKKKIHDVDDQIKMIEGFYDRLKDLSLQKKGLTKKMEEYSKLVVHNAKIRKQIVMLGLKIEKSKNKMVAAESISTDEDKMKDIDREFERSNKEIYKKWDQIMDERGEVNQCWSALKDSIDEFE
ncbi:hypothetical protein DSAG12_00536 [Promethearchaeum syntrophicum]|uniref:Chromosome partition protein Smc n=1 Tax=Promethearchaeum syntrophicum TaxID=2594042 RepID=A0A5B9D6X3_9ARCH|nr:hypothetical protein [Candidatus Prometheoarchaeum syntrophicum]QEE14721.1 hypothetical protein DSAG12_00536 [Candidatus Prometheoarchaeum syntrophicum]